MSDTALRELRTLIVSLLPCRYRSEADFFREYLGDLDHFGSLDQQKEDLASFWGRVDCKLFPHHRPSNISLADTSILTQWKRICARLAANSRPHQLSLSLVADVDDVETAKAILDPLSGMPPLRDVAINLGHHLKGIKGFDSKSFTRNAAKGLLGKTENIEKSPFRFMSLPLDLQIQILQQTHLLAGENVHFRRGWVFRSSDLDRQCDNERLRPRDGEDRLSAMAGVESFCRGRHPDAFTQHCECGSFRPDTYFKVSKDFSYIARHVFYSSNKLCFHPAPIRGWGSEYGYRLTLPHFLRRIPLESLWSLRSLCVIFPVCSPDYLLPDQVDWHAWVESIERLSRLADLSRLKLEVHFSGSPRPRPDGTQLFEDYPYGQYQLVIYRHSRLRRRKDESMEKAMFNTYKRILEPLKKLGYKLPSLQVYLPWSTIESVHEERKKHERSLERMIMGDKYDAAKWGKRDTSEFFKRLVVEGDLTPLQLLGTPVESLAA
jgi:hypothetical protein